MLSRCHQEVQVFGCLHWSWDKHRESFGLDVWSLFPCFPSCHIHNICSHDIVSTKLSKKWPVFCRLLQSQIIEDQTEFGLYFSRENKLSELDSLVSAHSIEWLSAGSLKKSEDENNCRLFCRAQDLSDAEPTFTHMALSKLFQEKKVGVKTSSPRFVLPHKYHTKTAIRGELRNLVGKCQRQNAVLRKWVWCDKCVSASTCGLSKLWWFAHQKWSSLLCSVRSSRQYVPWGIVSFISKALKRHPREKKNLFVVLYKTGVTFSKSQKNKNKNKTINAVGFQICTECSPQREYMRLFDVTERTAVRRHKTGRTCHR